MNVMCGCGKHHVRIGHRSTVLWQGRYWGGSCAFHSVFQQLKQAQGRQSYLQRLLHAMSCGECQQPVGKGSSFSTQIVQALGVINVSAMNQKPFQEIYGNLGLTN